MKTAVTTTRRTLPAPKAPMHANKQSNTQSNKQAGKSRRFEPDIAEQDYYCAQNKDDY